MIKAEQSMIINRPVEEVWEYLSNVENMAKWDQGVLEAKLTSDKITNHHAKDAIP